MQVTIPRWKWVFPIHKLKAQFRQNRKPTAHSSLIRRLEQSTLATTLQPLLFFPQKRQYALRVRVAHQIQQMWSVLVPDSLRHYAMLPSQTKLNMTESLLRLWEAHSHPQLILKQSCGTVMNTHTRSWIQKLSANRAKFDPKWSNFEVKPRH